MTTKNDNDNVATPPGAPANFEIIDMPFYQMVKVEVPKDKGQPATIAPPPGLRLAGVVALPRSPILTQPLEALMVFEGVTQRRVQIHSPAVTPGQAQGQSGGGDAAPPPGPSTQASEPAAPPPAGNE